MPAKEFHSKPYDQGTRQKLAIFELYTQEWLPVFLAKADPPFPEIHVFDFFCGPGEDSEGSHGSPLRILKQLRCYQQRHFAGWDKVRIVVHFFDADAKKIEALKNRIEAERWPVPGVNLDVRTLPFEEAFREHLPILGNDRFAKLLIIDQFGVNAVSDEVFRQLIGFPVCDFIFFLSSSILHRFREHPAIKQKIAAPADTYHVHRKAYEYYRGLIPKNDEAFLAPFSIKKRSNIYGLLFGTRHPLGLHKFLQVAWANDEIAGEADFDIDRENLAPGELLLGFQEMKPRKVRAFEEDLGKALRAGLLRNEADLARFCIESGMTCQKAEGVLQSLKRECVITCGFRVPNIKNLRKPRSIRLL